MVIGVDSHKDSLTAALVDELGREVSAPTFDNSPVGHRGFVEWTRESGPVDRIGVECSGTYGAALCRALVAAGFAVVEVPTRMSVLERHRGGRPGKSDPGEALAIARVTAREERLPSVRRPVMSEDLAVLVDFRDELVVERTALANRLHADLVVLCPGYSRRCASLTTSGTLDRVVRHLRPSAGLRASIARQRVNRPRQLDRRIADLRRDVAQRVWQSGSSLPTIRGVGPLIAARIMAEVGDVSRYPTANHFASANGTAPIPASSGRTVRHRLNPGGNRRLNRALYYVAITQASRDERGRASSPARWHPGRRGARRSAVSSVGSPMSSTANSRRIAAEVSVWRMTPRLPLTNIGGHPRPPRGSAVPPNVPPRTWPGAALGGPQRMLRPEVVHSKRAVWDR